MLHLTPPEGLNHKEWWLRLKLSRATGRRYVTLLDTSHEAFSFTLPDVALELLHKVDQEASGRIAVADSVTNPATGDRYVVTSLIEEAITSSQLSIPSRGIGSCTTWCIKRLELICSTWWTAISSRSVEKGRHSSSSPHWPRRSTPRDNLTVVATISGLVRADDAGAIYSYEDTREVATLIVGRAVTGTSAIV